MAEIFRIPDWSMEGLWKGCILASIAHAIAGDPEWAFEHSWDGMNYCTQWDWGRTNFTYATVSFDGEYCAGAFRKEVIMGVLESTNNFKPAYKYFENAPENIIKLAETQTLQYLLQEREGEVQPCITAAFWGNAEGIYTNDFSDEEWYNFWRNGGEALENQIMDTESAIDEYAEGYDFSEEEVELLKSIYERKIKNPNDPITLTKEEIIVIMGGKEGGMKQCATSFEEIGIYFDWEKW
jgi:hypothetical protein